ncbi:MAG: HD domain-containing phosphohydrolase [Pseudomonadota bacterium]
MNRRVLFVDDEPNVLQAIKRATRKDFEVVTAVGGEAGLEAVARDETYALIVSDMRMPGMNGVEFLRAAKRFSPDSVRIMLTGNSDQTTAIEAVNEGEVFRFLTKPCDLPLLRSVIEQGIRQYQLVTAEQELLEQTLKGSIGVLADLLAMARPDAFGRTARLSREVTQLLKDRTEITDKERWEIDTASMLSQLGSMNVPADLLAKLNHGQLLQTDERHAYQQATSDAAQLLNKVPRMESVAEIIAYQHKHYDGGGLPNGPMRAENIPLGARALHLIQVRDELKAQGYVDDDLRTELLRRKREFDPRLLDALLTASSKSASTVLRTVAPDQLQVGMEVNADVVNTFGSLLVCEGQIVTQAICDHLQRFVDEGTLTGDIEVLVAEDTHPQALAS